MKPRVRDVVCAPGYRPSLRSDIRFYRDGTSDVLVVHDVSRDRKFHLYESECVIARAMDGTRSLEELTSIARQHVTWATRDQVERLAIQIAGMGLLANIPLDLIARPSAPLPAATPSPDGDEMRESSDGLDDWTALSDSPFDDDEPPRWATKVPPAPAAPNTLPRSVPVVAIPPSDARPGRSSGVYTSAAPPPRVNTPPPMPTMPAPLASSVPVPVLARGTLRSNDFLPKAGAPAAQPTDPTPWSDAAPTVEGALAIGTQDENLQHASSEAEPAQEAAGEAAETESATTEPAPAEAPAEPAPVEAPADEQAGEAWEEEKPSWFALHRKLVIAAVVAGIVLLLGIIPYPLYITEQCNVIPVERLEVRAQIEGIVSEVLVKEGELVEVGTPLVRLDDRDLQYALQQATANVDRLAATLDKVKTGNRPEEIRRAQALVQTRKQDVRFAMIEGARQQKLYRAGVASAAQRDEALRVQEVKRSELAEAEAALKLIQSGSRSEEVRVAEAELRRAEADVAYIKKKMEFLVIKSDIAGRVLTPRIHERLHERLVPGDTIAEIGSSDHMNIEILVNEADADVIKLGQAVKVKVKSYPLEEFEGTVELIAPAVKLLDGRHILRVEARVNNQKGLLRPRMTGYAEIDAGERTVLGRMFRGALRWIRVRFLL